MKSATITSKDQVTIPKEIRDYLKLEIGSKIDFVIDENGTVRVIPLTIPVTALSGMLHCPNIPAVTIENMESAITQGASNWT